MHLTSYVVYTFAARDNLRLNLSDLPGTAGPHPAVFAEAAWLLPLGYGGRFEGGDQPEPLVGSSQRAGACWTPDVNGTCRFRNRPETRIQLGSRSMDACAYVSSR